MHPVSAKRPPKVSLRRVSAPVSIQKSLVEPYGLHASKNIPFLSIFGLLLYIRAVLYSTSREIPSTLIPLFCLFGTLRAARGPPREMFPPKKVLTCKKMPKRTAVRFDIFCCAVMKHGCLPGDVLFATWWFGK